MELIERKEEGCFLQCNVCESLNKKIVEFNADDFYGNNRKCEKCLKKAILLINPITFDREIVISILRFGSAYSNRKENEEREKFIEWFLKFLEIK